VPPSGRRVFTPNEQVDRLKAFYKKFNINTKVEGVEADEIGHIFIETGELRFKYAPSYAMVVHEHRIVLIDECEDPKAVFKKFKDRYSGYTIAVMRNPYPHSATSYLNNP